MTKRDQDLDNRKMTVGNQKQTKKKTKLDTRRNMVSQKRSN